MALSDYTNQVLLLVRARGVVEEGDSRILPGTRGVVIGFTEEGSGLLAVCWEGYVFPEVGIVSTGGAFVADVAPAGVEVVASGTLAALVREHSLQDETVQRVTELLTETEVR